MENVVVTQPDRFLFGGACKTTLISTKTGTQFTYTIRVNAKEDSKSNQRMYFITVMQEDESFLYAGFIRVDFKTKQLTYTKGTKGNYRADTPPIKALMWALKRALNEQSLEAIHICHWDVCAICGKPMTSGEGENTGIGPNCRKRMPS